MMPISISTSEFIENFDTYAHLVETQDFQITQDNTVIGLWTHPSRSRKDLATSLEGSVYADIDLERDRGERRDRRARVSF